jgi:serine/threonine protein kinase
VCCLLICGDGHRFSDNASTPPGEACNHGASNNPSPADGLRDLPGYETIDVIGNGGFGQVYKVRDLRMKRIAAAKSLRHSEASLGAMFGEYKNRFEREVVITANLAHPNIVIAYTTLSDAG